MIYKTVPVEVWEKCLRWSKEIHEKKSYSQSRQVLIQDQDSYSALAEMYYAKWLEQELIPAKWNGLKVHAGGDDGDIHLTFGGVIDVKARQIRQPFSKPEWEQEFYFNVDHKTIKDGVTHYMFAYWCEATMTICLCGWLDKQSIFDRPSSQKLNKGDEMRPGVYAHNELTRFKLKDLYALDMFYKYGYANY